MRLLVLPHREASAAVNMATDAGLRAWAGTHGIIGFRFYSWTLSALTIGYSQPMGWAQSNADATIEVVRRETGGGVVDHRNDLTYALAIPKGHSAWSGPPAEIYRTLHASLAASWEERKLAVSLAPCSRTCGDASPMASHCFSAPAPDDVIETRTGRKLAGAAMRRHAKALLLQGSIERHPLLTMLDDALWRKDWLEKLAASLQADAIEWLEEWPSGLPDKAEVARFQSHQWNHRR